MADAVEAKTDEVCRMFRNTSRCRFGEQCRYQHTAGEPIEVPERPIKPRGICFNWTKNEPCKFAERCKFFHGTEEEAVADAQAREKSRQEKKAAGPVADTREAGHAGERKKRRRTRKPKAVGAGAAPAAGATSTRAPVVDEFDVDGKVICRNFKKRAKCRFGNECTYSHNVTPDAQPAPGSKTTQDGDAKSGGRARRVRTRKPKPNTCFSFRDNKTCEYGDECRFKHGDDDTRVLGAARTPTRGVCYNWSESGTCTRDNCRFSHENATA